MSTLKTKFYYLPVTLLILFDFISGSLYCWPLSAYLPELLNHQRVFAIAGSLFFSFVLWLLGNYRNQHLLHGEVKLGRIGWIIFSMIVIDLYFFTLHPEMIHTISGEASLRMMLYHLSAIILLVSNRLFILWLTGKLKRRDIIRINSVIIIFQEPSENVLKKTKQYIQEEHNHLNGYFASTPLRITEKYALKYLGPIEKATAFLESEKNDEIIIFGNPAPTQITSGLFVTLKMMNAEIKMIPTDFNLLSGLVKISSLKEMPHIKLTPHSLSQANRLAKSLLNIIISLAGILFTLILFPFIALAVKSSSKGPLFYKQKRLGKGAHPFTLYKFRTMYPGAENNGPQLSSSTDPRITPVGRILRYWHLDELPQFWNILKGDMAVVGPRPERPHFARMLRDKTPYYKAIYQIKPGLTSLGMVKYGYACSLEEMIDRLYFDIAYINNPSFITDIRIIAHTLFYIFKKIYQDPKKIQLQKENAVPRLFLQKKDILQRWIELQQF